MKDTVLFLHGPMLNDSRLFLSGLSDFAAAHGWKVQHAVPPDKAGTDYLAKIAALWQPVGIVTTYGHDTGMPLPNAALDVPFVFLDRNLDRPVPPSSSRRVWYGFVNCDSEAIADFAARALLARDFASYAYVSAAESFYWSDVRQRRFVEAVGLMGNVCSVFDGKGITTGNAGGIKRLGKWLQSLDKPCGLLAANDWTASCVLSAAAQVGVAVPDELSVLGVDDLEYVCETASPPLSSIRIDFRSGGRLAGQLVHKLVHHRLAEPPQLFYGPVALVNRLSTRRIAKSSPSVRLALETIRKRVTEGVSAADILPLLGGTRRTAEKRFRAAVGKSILEEIIDVRFEKLIPLLLDEHCVLGSLAGQTGFSSENILQRTFKARYGMTLSAYRKKHLQNRSSAIRRT